MRAAEARPIVAVTRRRRSFGLDAPRPPDLGRTEATILDWLATHMPQVFWVRAAEPATQGKPPRASTLVLLLPGGRVAVLRIAVGTPEEGSDAAALARQCARRRIPVCVVRDIDETRAALRRLGVEAEEA